MKKRKILATGGLMATMLMAGTSPALAQSIQGQRSSGYDTNTRPDMADFGILADDELEEGELEESSRQILIDEGFSPAQIHKIMTSKYASEKYDAGFGFYEE